MSAIALYRKCPRAFKYAYVDRYIPKKRSEAADLGTGFHSHAAFYYGSQVPGGANLPRTEHTDAMLPVWAEYLRNNPMPQEVLAVEKPFYTKLIRQTWMRTTFDLVYRDADGWIVGRDYKTFEKSPTLDVDLDFQGRTYIAALMQYYKTPQVRFEYEYVRRVPPGTANSKGFWQNHECYIRVPVIIPRREATELWAENQEWTRRIRRDIASGKFPHAGTRKEFGSPCLGCFQLDICKAELQHGTLDDQDLEFFVEGIADELVLPEAV